MEEKNATYKFSFVFSVRFCAEIKAIKAVLYLGYFFTAGSPLRISGTALLCLPTKLKHYLFVYCSGRIIKEALSLKTGQ